MPYEKIVHAARLRPRRAAERQPDRQPTPWARRAARRRSRPTSRRPRRCMAEAGFPNGFETTLSFDQGFATVNEPMAVLAPGIAGPDRHQDHHQQDPGRELARAAAQEGHAALHQRVRRLAELPRVLLLLDLPRAERGVQHHVLPEPGDGQADRRRALRERPEEVRGAACAASSRWPSTTCRASRSSSPSSTWRCRRTSRGYQYWFHRQLDYRQLTKQ